MLPVSPEGTDADSSLSSCEMLLAMKENCMVGSIPPFFSLLLFFLHLTSLSIFCCFFLRGFHRLKGNIFKEGGQRVHSLIIPLIGTHGGEAIIRSSTHSHET